MGYSSDSSSSTERRHSRHRRRTSSSSDSDRHRHSRRRKPTSRHKSSKSSSYRSRRSRSRGSSRYSRSASRDHHRRRSRSSERRSRRSDSRRNRSRRHSSTSSSSSSSSNSSTRKFSSSNSSKKPSSTQINSSDALRDQLSRAIKAAELADHKLKEQGVLPKTVKSRNDLNVLVPVKPNQQEIIEIEDDEFVPKSFKSSKKTIDTSKSESSQKIEVKPKPEIPSKTIFHSSFFDDPQSKVDRWIKKLFAIRQKALNEEMQMG